MGSEDEALQREVRRILTAPDRESENPFNPKCQHLIPAQHLVSTPKRRGRESPEPPESQKLRVKGRCDPSEMDKSGGRGISQPTTATKATRLSMRLNPKEVDPGLLLVRKTLSLRERREGIKGAVKEQIAKESQQNEDLVIPGLDLLGA
jgi:hypothetical protein